MTRTSGPFIFSLLFFHKFLSSDAKGLFFLENPTSPSLQQQQQKCPPSINGPLLEIVGDVKVHQKSSPQNNNNAFGCSQTLECSIMSSPIESTILWFKNGKLIELKAIRELALDPALQLDVAPSGVGEISHRICVDPFLMMGETGEFKCRARLSCDPSVVADSSPVRVVGVVKRPSLKYSKAEGAKARRSIKPPFSAPLIETITASRVELAGNIAQMICKASGNPKPRIHWTVLAEDGGVEEPNRPATDFPFILEMSNGDLLVDTTETNLASLTLTCQALNRLGTDSAESSLVILSGN